MIIQDKRLTTNLTFLPRPILHLLADSDIRPCVSIDGHTTELHEQIRGKGTFIKTITNLELLIGRGVDVEVTHTLNSSNFFYFFEFVNFLKEIGVRRLNLHKLSIKGNAINNAHLDITPTMWRALTKKIETIRPAEEGKIAVRYELAYVTEEEMQHLTANGYQNHAQSSFYASGNRLVLYPDGNIYISSESFGTDAYIGSFASGAFKFNSLPQNELVASERPDFDVSYLDPRRKGDANYPIPISVSFRRLTSI